MCILLLIYPKVHVLSIRPTYCIILSTLESFINFSVLYNCVICDSDRYHIFTMLCDMCDSHTVTHNIFLKSTICYMDVTYKSTCLETTFPWWNHLWTIQACLPWQPPFSQHVSWWCCNPLDIPSSTVEILLFNSVFYDRVTPVSVLTLKPPLGQ